MRQAFAGHGGEVSVSVLPQLMPHELGILIAGLTVGLLILCVLVGLALFRMSRLERRIALLEEAHRGSGRSQTDPPIPP